MTRMRYDEAIDHAVAQCMAEDETVVVLGEDVHTARRTLFVRFGDQRVLPTPISEGAFVGAAVGAAMAGLRPVVELIMVDFITVALDAVLNHMAKLADFSGGKWTCPLVLRAPCGGWYGDGGQHQQSLWGMLGGFPGLTVVAPSTPEDAASMMVASIRSDDPVVFLEHKLLEQTTLEMLGRGGRKTVDFDIPPAGAEGDVPDKVEPLPPGRAAVVRSGGDLTLVSLSIGVHRCLTAADRLLEQGIEAEVIDLRSVRPLDHDCVAESVARTGRLVVVDEDYRECGLSGEIAATVMEAGQSPRFARVCLEGNLPFDRRREWAALPNAQRIVEAAVTLCD